MNVTFALVREGDVTLRTRRNFRLRDLAVRYAQLAADRTGVRWNLYKLHGETWQLEQGFFPGGGRRVPT